jgi:CRISPR-associated endonuclease/helicase Cas3
MILSQDLYRFWAKTTQDKENEPRAYHPLMCHMIDVAAVALQMWDEVLPVAAKRRIVAAFGQSHDEIGLARTGRLIAWIAGLHDLGKASPPFALRVDSPSARLLGRLYEGTPFKRPRGNPRPFEVPHGYVTAEALPQILRTKFGFSAALANELGALIGGHHGVFPRSLELINLEGKTGDRNWRQAREQLTIALAEALQLPSCDLKDSNGLDQATIMILAGLVSVADWIGSNSNYFPCECRDFEIPTEFDSIEYLSRARRQASNALTELGWTGWPKPVMALSFSELFPELRNYMPRGVQRTAINAASFLKTPGLVVIEAPMGEGKTEAAMYLADSWNVTLDQRGIYFALPTQATSNQMFGRVRRFLSTRFDGNVLLQLLHGHAALSAEFQSLLRKGAQPARISGIFNDDPCSGCEADGAVAAAEWFTHRKRGLLAPYGVGTVDQALMGILQTRHVFVRLFGLAHKTIIVDEVHAYDAYMSKLLERLLEWLAVLGSPVVLLSATLPEGRRSALIAAYRRGLGSDGPVELTPSANYPRLSWATEKEAGEIQIPVSPESARAVRIEWVVGRLPTKIGEAFALGERLAGALAGGGCTAVICNTVNRAQQVYLALTPYFSRDELDLFHARCLFMDRDAREKRALSQFGKQDNTGADDGTVRSRPYRAVLVATQVIEQSLDLDFDLMVSEPAPVDLLLQRSGRLHRHFRLRPAGLELPTLWICEPDEVMDEVPRFDSGAEHVYDAHIMLRSWLELRDREVIEIPSDIETLIESVYGEGVCPEDAGANLRDRWTETKVDLATKLRKMESEALGVIVPSPRSTFDILEAWNKRLEEDEPEMHKSLQALTRLSDPTITVVCLRAEERILLNLDQPPGIDDARFLLMRSVTLSHRGLVSNLLLIEPPSTWRKSAFLARLRLIELDESGCWDDGRYRLLVDKELGVVIAKI